MLIELFHKLRRALPALKNVDRRRRFVTQIIEYLIGGGVWFWSGYLAFALLYSGFGWNWLLAKILGDTVGFVANFFVQRYWAFNNPKLSKHNVRMTFRYVLIMVVQVILDYAIVSGLYALGLTPYIGAFVSSAALTLWNYFWFRFFVFNPK